MIKSTEEYLYELHPFLKPILPERIFFITTQELEDRFPSLTPKERENEIVRIHGAVFIMQIGGTMKSGQVHDGRSPDYDDWTLNGDIVLWYPVLNCAVEQKERISYNEDILSLFIRDGVGLHLIPYLDHN